MLLIFRTKYAGQSAKAPVIDCSRAGFYKVSNKNVINIAKIGEYSCCYSMIIFILADNTVSVPPVLVSQYQTAV